MLYKFNIIEKFLLQIDAIPHPIFDTLINPTIGRAVQEGVKLGMVESLSKEGKNIEQISRECQVNSEGAFGILECLVSLEYVNKNSNNKYSLTKRGKKFLLPDSPESLYYFVLFSDMCFSRLMNLGDNVKRGGPSKEDRDINQLSDREWEVLTKAMIEMAMSNYSEVLKHLPVKNHHKKLLDVGGSHGLYAIKACKKYLGLEAEILDFPATQKYAEELIEKNDMIEKVTFTPGDFNKKTFSKKYDVIFLFNLIHAYTPKENKEIIKKTYNLLNENGLCIILDQFRDLTGKHQLSHVLAAGLGLMLFNQAGGHTYSTKETKSWLSKEDFKKIKFKKIRTPGFGLIIAHK